MGILGRAGLSASFLVASSVMFAGNGAIAQSVGSGTEKYLELIREGSPRNPMILNASDDQLLTHGNRICTLKGQGLTTGGAYAFFYKNLSRYPYSNQTKDDYAQRVTAFSITFLCPWHKD